MSARISSYIRREEIRNMLGRWTSLSTAELLDKLSEKFGVDKKGLKANVMNDLDFLEKHGFIYYIGYDKLNRRVEDDEPYRYKKWVVDTLDEQESLVSGAQILKTYNSNLFYDDDCTHLEDMVSIKEGRPRTINYGMYFLYFAMNNELYHLEVNLENLIRENREESFNIVVVRALKYKDEKARKKALSAYTKKYGKSTIVLELNDPVLSRPEGSKAQLLVSFSPRSFPGLVRIEDMNSRYGTSVTSIDSGLELEILSELNNQTKTNYLSTTRKLEKDLLVGEKRDLRLPAYVDIKNKAGFLVKGFSLS